MFAFVIATFLVCWLPYHSYFLYSYHNPQVISFSTKGLWKGGITFYSLYPIHG